MKWHWSGQNGVQYIKQNGVTRVNQYDCQSVMTLVQKGNYVSHVRDIWQEDTPKISAHVSKNILVCKAESPINRLLGKFPACHP